MWWILAAMLLIAIVAWLALQYAIARNGPAVLDTVDRITGGSRDVELVHRASTGDSPFQKLRVYRSESGGSPKPVIIFAHGGSWRSGDPDDYGFVARAFVPEGFVVVLVGYRLGEGGEFPNMLRDMANAVSWTKANIAEYGGDPDAIFVSGHSAGAYNAAMVALDPQWLDDEGVGTDSIAGVIGLAGPYDFYPFDSDSTKAAFGDAPHPEATQPINFAARDAPPMLLMTGLKDTTVEPRNSRAMAAVLQAAGNRAVLETYPEFDHTGMLTALASPWRRDSTVIDRIIAFTRETHGDRNNANTPSVPVQAENR